MTSRVVPAAIVAIVSVFVCPAADPLRVTTASPSGPLGRDAPQRIQIVFDRPVVALGAADPEGAPPPWISVEPAVALRWRWAGTTTLVGEPVAAFPRATTFRFRVDAEAIRALDGSTLARSFEGTFSTPAPRAVIVAEWTLGEGDPVEETAWLFGRESNTPPIELGPDDPVLLVFDQPVDAESLRAALSVRIEPNRLPRAERLLGSRDAETLRAADPAAYAAWRRFIERSRGAERGEPAYRLVPDETHPDVAFRVLPVREWPESGRLEIEVGAAVRSLEGPDRGTGAKRAFTTPWPFAPLSVEGRRPRAGAGLDPDHLSLLFSGPVDWKAAAGHVRLRDVKSGARLPAQVVDGEGYGRDPRLTLDPFSPTGGRRYEVCVDGDLRDGYGRVVGFPWCTTFETAHHAAQFEVVEGSGVLEWIGPRKFPLSAVNVRSYRVESRRIDESELARLLSRPYSLDEPPSRERSVVRETGLTVDRWDVLPLDLESVLGGKPGVILSRIAVEEVTPGAEFDEQEARSLRRPRTAITQVTSLGLTVKSSLTGGLLVWVTWLQQAVPVAEAEVTARDAEGKVLWKGTTDAEGLARGDFEFPKDKTFVVTARRGDDLAYARAGWYEGHRGWEFNLPVAWRAPGTFEGFAWADRGVARPSESVHLKAVLRARRDDALAQPEAERATFVVRDARGEDAAVLEAKIDRWGAAETEYAIPAGAPLGTYSILVASGYDAERRRFPGDQGAGASTTFRVAEFRRPKFRVSVSADSSFRVAGDPLRAEVQGTFLAGGPMAGAFARWTVRSSPTYWRPRATRWDGWSFEDDALDDPEAPRGGEESVAQGEGPLGETGLLALALEKVAAADGRAARLEIEAEVEDVDRRTSTAFASVDVLPGEFLAAIEPGAYFVAVGEPARTRVAAVSPDGALVPGVELSVELSRRHWDSVRRRDTAGRYVWASEAVVESVETRTIAVRDEPAEVAFTPEEPGEYVVAARGVDARGNRVAASWSFYVLGPGFTPWRRNRENRIDLVTEKDSYEPGTTARILVKSPWERSLALVTIERAGVLETRLATLVGTTPVLEIPVKESYAPNVFVGVVLLRGRVDAPSDGNLLDPGRPAYRVGYAEIAVPPAAHRLHVEAVPAAGEIRPGEVASVAIRVADVSGEPRRASVTLWAVDAGVLALTGYRTPDLVEAFYARAGLGVTTAESRTRLIGRRSYGTKGQRPGGGGGTDVGDRGSRTDFRALAVWRGDVVTGADGRATVEFTVPDTLTTYRVMAVAVEGSERFGSAQAELRVTKPLGLEPALPRFLRPGDAAKAGVVVRNRTGAPREIEVRGRVLDGPVALSGAARRAVTVPAGGSVEVAFDLSASAPGRARLRFDASSPAPSPETDALTFPLEVHAIAPTETVATFFSTESEARESIAVPRDVYDATGGLELRLAPSVLVESVDAVRWLDGYRWRCAEQLSSKLLGWSAARRLGPGIGGTVDPAAVDAAVTDLLSTQLGDGGFALWPGSDRPWEFVAPYATWALYEARGSGANIDDRKLDRAANHLSQLLRRDVWPVGERDGWTTRVLAAFVLARIGRAEPAFYQALYDSRKEGRPLWASALLADAMLVSNPADPRADKIATEISSSLVVETRSARLVEPLPEWAWWTFWGSGRANAAALELLLRRPHGGDLADRLARSVLDDLRTPSRRTTQDTAWSLQALALYRERRESGAGTRTATASLAGETVARARFEGLDDPQKIVEVPMRGIVGRTLPLEVKVEGSGRVHAAALLSYASSDPSRPATEHGLRLSRRFLAEDGSSVDRVVAGTEVVLEIALETGAPVKLVVAEAPIPAGLEILDTSLATTGSRASATEDESLDADRYWWEPGFDHVERRDDRVVLFATELPKGATSYRVRCRATTPGRFVVAPGKAEAMYEPEIFGTTSAGIFVVEGKP